MYLSAGANSGTSSFIETFFLGGAVGGGGGAAAVAAAAAVVLAAAEKNIQNLVFPLMFVLVRCLQVFYGDPPPFAGIGLPSVVMC